MARIILGPLLGAESTQRYSVCAVFANNYNKHELKLIAGSHTIEYDVQELLATKYFYRFTINTNDKIVAYRLEVNGTICKDEYNEEVWLFTTTPINSTIATASCVGTSEMPIADYNDSNYLLWNHLYYNKPHLLILNGDQVYADSVIEKVFTQYCTTEALENFIPNEIETQKIKVALTYFFEELYIESWRKKYVQKCLASIPNIMIWDDHDIIDGYGSHNSALQNSPAFQLLFQEAKRFYELLQVRTLNNKSVLHTSELTQVHQFNNTLIIAFDTRSQRSQTQILKDGLQHVQNHLFVNNTLKPAFHSITALHFVVPIPIAHRQMITRKETLILKILSLKIFKSKAHATDDIIDQWNSSYHQAERQLVLNQFFTWANQFPQLANCCILSGDSHEGGLSIASNKLNNSVRKITQIVASPISNEAAKFTTTRWYKYFLLNKFKLGQIKVKASTKVGSILHRNYATINEQTITFTILQNNKTISTIEHILDKF